MKKNSLHLPILIAIFGLVLNFQSQSFAQIEEGTKVIGGTFQLHFEDNFDQIIILPDFAYAINENLTIGGRLGVTYLEFSDEGVQPAVGVYARKHFFLNDNFAFFGEALANYTPGFSTEFQIGVLPGLTYFFDERIAVEWAFGGILFSTGDDRNRFDVSFSPATNSRFGIKYYLR